eukprot:PhF_6_TR26144/c0_g1_i1/m.37033/K03929/pnbA; para-nitrobenzyl esterase
MVLSCRFEMQLSLAKLLWLLQVLLWDMIYGTMRSLYDVIVEFFSPNVHAHLPQGIVRGFTKSGERGTPICVFRGVPYAVVATPFDAPKPVPDNPNSILNCRRHGPSALQPLSIVSIGAIPIWYNLMALCAKSIVFKLRGRGGDGLYFGSPFCQNLNISTPSLTARLPVMVWFHGGGFAFGSGNDPSYEPTALASRNVVIVTVNYRLGVCGFLHVDGRPANRGLLDQHASLRWVQENIHLFGGDPTNVTIFGESAGAISCCAHVAGVGPSLTGALFHKAILQSGAAQGYLTREEANDIVSDSLAFLKVKQGDVIGLEKTPWHRLVACHRYIANLYSDRYANNLVSIILPFAPVVDSATLPYHPLKVTNSLYGKIPILCGVTLSEYSLFVALRKTLPTSVDLDKRIDLWLSTLDVPTTRGQLIDRYLKGMFVEAMPTPSLWNAVHTDYSFRSPCHTFARHHHGTIYMYRMDKHYWPPSLGAGHAVELPYVFGSYHLARPMAGYGSDVGTLSNRMMAAWVKFAQTGCPGWDRWSYSERDPAVMVFGLGNTAQCEVRGEEYQDELRAWCGVQEAIAERCQNFKMK